MNDVTDGSPITIPSGMRELSNTSLANVPSYKRAVMHLANHFDDLYLLTCVIEAKGFSAAAQQTGIPRSKLSRRIIELEQRLGVRLLHRNARRFSVTPLGEQVYQQALAMRMAVEAVEAVVHEAKHTLGGPVRVDMSALISDIMCSVLADFAATQPHIQLSITQNNGVTALLEQHADIVFILGASIPNNGDIVVRKLGSVRMVTVASPKLLNSRGALEHPEQLFQWPCLGYADHSRAHSWHLQGSPHDPQYTMVADNVLALLGAACAGLGVAQLPLHVCQHELASGQLRLVLEDFETPPWPLYALTLSNRAVSQTVRSVVNYCRDHLMQRLDWASEWILNTKRPESGMENLVAKIAIGAM